VSPHVVVVGAGIAGFAAALAAHAGGARVSVSAGPAGASELAGGAWDLRVGPGLGVPSDGMRGALRRLSTERPSHPLGRLPMGDALGDLEASHRAVLGALGTHRSPGFDAAPERVATSVGLAREAMLAQHAVLDLAGVAEGCIAVASLPGLRSFDARFVAASLTEQAVEEGRGQRFVALDVEMFRRAGDGLLLPHEAAEVLDAAEGLERFAVALKRALGGAALDGGRNHLDILSRNARRGLRGRVHVERHLLRSEARAREHDGAHGDGGGGGREAQARARARRARVECRAAVARHEQRGRGPGGGGY
jgi:hypothetical protein